VRAPLLLVGLLAVGIGAAPAAASAAPPTLAVHPAFIIARPQTTKLNFAVTMSSTSTSAVTVDYRTVDGTALAGSNYQAESGTATIAAGSTSATVSVPVNPAPISPTGTSKTMALDLSKPSGATLGTSSATGTIYPDPYTAKHTGSLNDVVIDPTSLRAYITNSTLNEVEVLNIHTGRYSAPILVGSDPTSIDITSDGKTLYVCDSGGQTISVVDVATRKVTHTIITPQGFDAEKPFSIAIGNAGYALFTTTFSGSGFGGHIYRLDLTSDAISVFTSAGINGQVTEDTPLTRSGDYSTIAGLLGDDSGGPYFVVTASSAAVTQGSLNAFIQWPALNYNGSTLLIDGATYGYGPGTYVVDSASGALIGTIAGTGAGLAMGSSTTAYRMVTDGVNVLDVPRFLAKGSLPAPDAQNPGPLALAPNGHTLVAPTSTGITIIGI
jgi:YVTN family beta-propeller protein